MNGKEVVFEDQRLKVERVGSGRLRTVRVTINDRALQAIELIRTAAKPLGESWHAKGIRWCSFRNVVTKKYVAVVVDGEVREYGGR